MAITNAKMQKYHFLKDMYNDNYFPDFLVDKGKSIVVNLCEKIEAIQPKTHKELFELTHIATVAINDLNEEFGENDSELETSAREAIMGDFDNIVKMYGFDVDIDDVLAPRDW